MRLPSWLTRKTPEPPPSKESESGALIAQQGATITRLNEALIELATREDAAKAVYMERVSELIEARNMAGSGPWKVAPGIIAQTDRLITEALQRFNQPMAVRENAITAQGAYGDIELALQNVQWRREVNLSWMEFSRWGIQQIILVCRLNYIKNPIIRRLTDVCAAYVFARGVEVSTNDEAANEVLADFFEKNKSTLGQNALTDLERRKDYDGNLFFILFPDTQNLGTVKCRTIDATEIQEVITDPEDMDTPWLYRRVWQEDRFDILTGQRQHEQGQRWYPALGHDPVSKPEIIGGYPVSWDSPVLHRKAGAIAKWHFGCPRMYPALDWAKEGRKVLEARASVEAALSQVAMTITTKGGQQALAGIKQQMGTTVGPTSALWDQNPPAVSGGTFASGPGTKLEAFSRGSQGNLELMRQMKLMCCMVAGVPETFLGDVSTGNLATATSLDRPTETVFLEKQEAWREDLVTLAKYVLSVSSKAPSGRLREAAIGISRPIRECKSRMLPNGRRVYEALSKPEDAIELRCNFPAIREADIPQLVSATVQAMTLGTQSVIGIDEKAGMRQLYDLLPGIDNGEELVEQQFPEATYEHDRTLEPEPEDGGGEDGVIDGQSDADNDPVPVGEARRIRKAMARVNRALVERANGNAH